MQVKVVFLFPFLISLLPILLWGGYFYYKNPRKQGGKEILKIFGLGIFSVFPIMILHQWVMPILGNKLHEMWPAFEHPFLFGFLELVVIIFFIFFFVLLFAFLHSLQLRWVYHLKWYVNFSTIYKRLYSLSPLLFFFSGFVLLELFFSFQRQESFILSVTGATILFAILEEYFKYIINPFLVYKKINSVGTAMVHALYVGLAFAFVENGLFFYDQFRGDQFLMIFSYRSLFTTLMHVGASGIIGYFYGLSIFGKAMLVNQEIEKSQYKIPVWLEKLLKKTTLYQSMLLTQGFFLASLLHAVFNLFIQIGKIGYAAGLAIAMAGTVVFLLNSKSTQVQYGLIGSSTMPEEDFEKLRLQISVLQHVKEIQKTQLTTSDS